MVAYKSCAWAQYLARKAGVKFVLGPVQGKVVNVGTNTDGRPFVETSDGVSHQSHLVVVSGVLVHLKSERCIIHG